MYFTIRGRAESAEDKSYQRTIQEKGKPDREETVMRYQLTLTVPGMTDLVKCDLTPERVEGMPAVKVMEQWELDETWVVVSADAMRLSKGETDGRSWALVTFSAVKVEEMSQQERATLVDARRKVKSARKQKSAEARKAKTEAKKTAQPAA